MAAVALELSELMLTVVCRPSALLLLVISKKKNGHFLGTTALFDAHLDVLDLVASLSPSVAFAAPQPFH